MEALLQALVEVQLAQRQATQAMTERMVALTEAVQARGSTSTPLPLTRTKAKEVMMKMAETDDVEAYLHTFEWVAERELWDPREMADILAHG